MFCCNARFKSSLRAASIYPSEQQQLHDLFGEPARWGQTLRPLLWANVSLVVPGFQDQTTVIVPLPCTFDFTVATTKYFHGLSGGEIPLAVFFSGTLFHTDVQWRHANF